jgi:hypothetical protein
MTFVIAMIFRWTLNDVMPKFHGKYFMIYTEIKYCLQYFITYSYQTENHI